ncbi:MAG: hypothetical protein ABR572_03320 [Cryomorphaceae bacterium]
MTAKGNENIKRMMYACTAWLLWMLCFGQASAQNSTSVIWGPRPEKGNQLELIEVFGADTNFFYTMSGETRKNSALFISRIEADSLRPLHSCVLALPDVDGRQAFYLQSLDFAGKSYIIGTTESSKGELIELHAYEIDDSLRFGIPPVFLGNVHRTVMAQNRNYQLITSTDNRFLALVATTELDLARNEKFEIKLFDSSLNLAFQKQLEIPYAAGDVNYGDIIVDSDVAIYLLMDVPSPRLKEMDKVAAPAGDYFMIRYNFKQNTVSEKALSIGVKWIYEARLKKNTAGDIQVFGYFSNMVDPVMAGTFSVSFDAATGRITDNGLAAFDRAFKAQFRPRGNVTDRSDLALYDIGYTFAQPDSEMLMVSEKRDLYRSTIFNPATGTYFVVENFMYEEILLTQISTSGEGLMNFKIPKFQASGRSDDNHLSYLAARDKDRTFFIFNDHERNAGLDIHSNTKYSVLSGRNNAQAVMYRFGPGGHLSKEVLFKNSPSGGVFIPTFCYQLSGALVIYTEGSAGGQFVRLGLETARESE